jgi:hypothetical protein
MNNSEATVSHFMSDRSMQMTLLIGDFSYADSAQQSTEDHPCDQSRWDSWGVMVQPMTTVVPLMGLAGNHEVENEGLPPPATQESFVAYQARFFFPAAASGATEGNLYYSFNVAGAHVIMLSSFSDYSVGSAQYNWLLKDLQMVDRRVTPWLFAAMHAPWYNSNTAHHDEVEETTMRKIYEGIFNTHKVDMVFAGHVHAYERSHPVYNGNVTPGAPTYITIGDGGNREGHADTWYPAQAWAAFQGNDFGHGRLELVNSTYAHWTWHSIMESEATVSDEVILTHNSEHGGVTAIPKASWAAEHHAMIKAAAAHKRLRLGHAAGSLVPKSDV